MFFYIKGIEGQAAFFQFDIHLKSLNIDKSCFLHIFNILFNPLDIASLNKKVQ